MSHFRKPVKDIIEQLDNYMLKLAWWKVWEELLY